MNLHAPQSVEAATELREIAAVPLQIVSPRESTPIVSVVQDTLVGANRFTRPNVLFTKKEAMNLLVHAKSWNGKLPEPATTAPQPMWSGQQLLSALLPPVSLQMPNSSYSDSDKSNPNSQNLVKIINGQITQGILDKSVFSKQLLHIIYNDFGPDITVDFLDSLQAMIASFLMNSGFSVGISDLIADDDTNAEIAVALSKLTKTIEDQILQLHTGLFENSSGRSNQEEFEGKLMGTLNKAVGDAGKIGLKSLADTNRMTNMIKAGSKGSDVNVSQMVATLGQQAIEGKRVPNGFQHRTLPHFKRFDDSAQARGFIASSYIKGLQPDEFFFHAMSGREGLIDTAVKSVTGDTPIIIQCNGVWKTVEIGDWIDNLLKENSTMIEYSQPANLELLKIAKTHIWTCDSSGCTSIAEISAVTRHDPGDVLYRITTTKNQTVIVSANKSLIVLDMKTNKWIEKAPSDVRAGVDVVPVLNKEGNEVSGVSPVLISSIESIPVTEKFKKLYDLTVPSTLNFAIANGIVVRDTADTGYMQRQIRVALEDLITQHDGSVRDAMGNIVQISYGEDGINATKLESQPLPLASMGDEDIRQYFTADGAPGAEQYIQAVMEDRRILVEKVFLNKPQKNVRYPVHLERLLYAIRNGFKLVENEGTVTATEVLEAQNRILSRTHAKNRLWGALIRYHLAPRNLQKIGYTSVALDALVEQIVLKHWKSWVEPGQPVGVIAAQSIGEPATQMSVLYSTKVQIHNKNGSYSGAIGAYIDKLLETQKDKVVTIGKDSVVLDIHDGDAIVGVSTDEKTSWIPISQVSRHPANGGLVEVHTRTGRVTTATLTHSFLKRTPIGVDSVLGSDLKVGDRVPVAVTIPEVATPIRTVTQGKTIYALNKSFGWLCGLYIADGCFQGAKVSISKVNPYVEKRLSEMATIFGFTFSVVHKKGAYGPGKDNNIHSKDLRDFLEAHFSHGSFGKAIHGDVFHMPREFIAGLISGYFDGDGNISVERQHIRLSSRNEQLMRDINRLLGYCGLFGYLGKETSIRMPDAVQYTLNIPKSLIGKFAANIGLELPEKAEALQQILTYKARLDKPDRSQDMLDKIPACGDLIAETGKLLELPGQSRNYGRWAKKESIGRDTLQSYLPKFREGLTTVKDKAVFEKVTANIKLLEQAVNSDILWDEIVELNYLEDPHTFVYDFTVPGNDSFMVDDNILVHNTLNSVDWNTDILIAKDGQIQIPKIGEFIDNYLESCDPAKIQRLPNDQLYVPLDDGHEWSAISCDENGEMMWTKLEAVTKHPVVNEDGTDTILEVTTESGRTVKATKGKSFLTLRDGKIVDMNGSDLVVGDILPIANTLAIHQIAPITKLDLKTVLSPTEFLFGDEVEKALNAVKEADATGNRHWFQHANGKDFTVPYSRSDCFREAFLTGANKRVAEFKPGFVYPKSTRSCSSQIPAILELNREFGYFVGAFVAEGSSSTTQIQITNNDDGFLVPIRKLMDSWSVGHHTVSSEKDIVSSGIKGRSTSLIIHSTLLTTAFRTMFGVNSYTKTLPDWVFQAPDNFVKGFMDGYMSGDGYVDNRNTIHCSSSSDELIERLSALFARFQIFTRISSYEPKIQKFKSVARHYTLTIPPKYSYVFANTFTLSIAHKQERLNAIQAREGPFVCKEKEFNNVILDRVKTIKEVSPKGGRVYDLTVEKTRNFTALNLLCVKDTFHLSGVASKSAMTRGVPRLKELLKATSNPKAIELTVPLRRDLRDKKEEARRVAQELEFTLLQDIVTVARIYFDPRDSATLIAEDVDWLAYLSAYESAATPPPSVVQPQDPLAGGAGVAEAVGESEMPEEPKKSPWILRFELDKERMFAKNITMDDIAFILKTKFHADITTLYTDYNATRLVFRVRIINEDEESFTDDLMLLKSLQNKILVGTAIRGIPGLRAVNYQKISDQVELKDGKYQAVDQYMLITDGSNFLEVLTHPDVDPTRVLSSNVHDMFKNLGIEATRATFFKEITTLFAESGSSVNYRHVCILLDMMCHKGKTMSVDRYGINKNNIGPLAKMSFEQTEDIALRAATFGERDPVLGVSAKVMLGAPIKAGTSFSELLFDEVAAQNLIATTPEQRPAAVGGPVGFTEDELDNALYGEDDTGACGVNELRMNVAIPPQSDLVTEEVDEDIEIAIVE